MWRNLGANLLLCLSRLFSSLILLCNFALIWPGTHPLSHKKKKKNWQSLYIFFRNSCLLMFIKTVVLKNFAILTGKHLCWSLFLVCNFIKKRFQCRRFPVNIAKFLKTAFFINTSSGYFCFLKPQCTNARYSE